MSFAEHLVRVIAVSAVVGFIIGTTGALLDAPLWVTILICAVVGWNIPRLVVRR